MLAGEQVIALTQPNDLFLVPMTEGAPSALPKIRSARRGSASPNKGPQSQQDFFCADSLRSRSLTPVLCVMSNYRIVLNPVMAEGASNAAANVTQLLSPTSRQGTSTDQSSNHMRTVRIPYMLIHKYETDIRPRDNVFAVTITSKWTWVIRLQSRSEEPVRLLASHLERQFPKSLSQMFAFPHFAALQAEAKNVLSTPLSSTGGSGSSFVAHMRNSIMDSGGVYDTAWGAFNLEKELLRQTVPHGETNLSLEESGCGHSLLPWFHIVSLQRPDLFQTYPLEVVVPKRASSELVERVALFRQNGRIPAVSWIHAWNGATLSRASQPKFRHKSEKDDQEYCSYLNQSYHTSNAARSGATAAVTPTSRHVPPPPLAPAALTSTTATTSGGGAPLPPPQQPPSLFDEDTSSNDGSEAPADFDVVITVESDDGSKEDALARTQYIQNQSEQRRLHFVDCRSRTAATANLATGGGFEMVKDYDRAELHFMNLENIHAVRSSLKELRRLCSALQHIHVECPTTKTVQGSFHERLAQTNWALHIERLIWASWKVATFLHHGESVLVHCTDGWDRTSQVVCLAKIQLDPHYRTIEGLCELVAWEWCHMGHRFADRCGHLRGDDEFVVLDHNGDEDEDGGPTGGGAGSLFSALDTLLNAGGGASPMLSPRRAAGTGAAAGPGGTPNSTTTGASTSHNRSTSPKSQSSPIFLQFMDALFQLLQMFPHAFEYTPHFLFFLLEGVYSCRVGTFLYNCLRSRNRRNGVVSRTASLWGEVESLVAAERSNPLNVAVDERFINPFFIPSPRLTTATEPNETLRELSFYQQRIVPSFHMYRYRFWGSLYCRFLWEGPGVPFEMDPLVPLCDAVLVLRQHTMALMRAVDPATLRTILSTKAQLDGSGGSGSSPSEKLMRLLVEEAQGASELAQVDNGDWTDVRRVRQASTALLDPAMEYRSMFLSRTPLSHLTGDWLSVKPVHYDAAGSGTASDHTHAAAASSLGGLLGDLEEPIYVPRSNASSCELCNAEFTLFFRRHTCRRCCRSACSNCAKHFLAMPKKSILLYEERDATQPVRLCNQCFDKMKHLK